MGSPRKFDDEELLHHWSETGTIRETARRLKASYTAVHERLEIGGHIQASTFNPDRPHTARTIPEHTTLVIPDLQAPAHHPDALAFLCAVRDRYKPINTVCIGDEVDLNWLSNFEKIPEADQPHSEWAAAQSFMRKLYSEFWEGVSCKSNHVEGRIDKARMRGRLPAAFLRSVEDLLDVPVGWSFHSEIRMGDILFRHGHRDTSGLKKVICEEIPAKYGRHYSLVIGHFHSRFGVATPDIKIGDKVYWGAFTGCLVDPSHPFFGYSKGYEKLGCAIVTHGRFNPCCNAGEGGRSLDRSAAVTKYEIEGYPDACDFLAKEVLEEVPLSRPIGFMADRLVPRYPEEPATIVETPRALMTPTVWQARDPATVCIRTPTSAPDEYFETVLTPEEAIRLASDLLSEALRAQRFSRAD